jgi:hypothetical protein
MSYGYLPWDDALRHAAHAVDGRDWSSVMVLNADFKPGMDTHPGWHRLLRLIHTLFDADTSGLVIFSVVAAFVFFTWGGVFASGAPLAWLISCAVIMSAETGLFQRFTLGRPMFFSMTSLMVMLFVWERKKPLKWLAEMSVCTAMLTLSICMHPTISYLWLIVGFALLVCGRWREMLRLGGSLVAAILLAAALLQDWYNIVILPLDILGYSVLQDPLVGTNLVGELQPSGGPLTGLVIMALIITIRCTRGDRKLRDELLRVDVCLVLIAWVLALKIGRFWSEWGLPAMAVWLCLQIKELLKIDLHGLQRVRDTACVTLLSASAFYLGMTTDIGGRYTATLKNVLLTKPVEDFSKYLPEDGGVIYTADMSVFFRLYFRMPHAKFRYITGFEAGFMPPEDLKVMRAVQFNNGLFDAYKPWLEKMTSKDRIIVGNATKPEWEYMEFQPFYGAWIGKRIDAKKSGDNKASSSTVESINDGAASAKEL